MKPTDVNEGPRLSFFDKPRPKHGHCHAILKRVDRSVCTNKRKGRAETRISKSKQKKKINQQRPATRSGPKGKEKLFTGGQDHKKQKRRRTLERAFWKGSGNSGPMVARRQTGGG